MTSGFITQAGFVENRRFFLFVLQTVVTLQVDYLSSLERGVKACSTESAPDSGFKVVSHESLR